MEGLLKAGLDNELYSLGIETHLGIVEEGLIKYKGKMFSVDVEKEIQVIKEKLGSFEN